MPEDGAEFWGQQGMRKDWVDLRDQPYTPSLSVLRQELFMDHRVMGAGPEPHLRSPFFGVRDQSTSGRCVGHALANVIDLQRSIQVLRGTDALGREQALQTKGDADIVSADMLYRMARFHDHYHVESGGPDTGQEGVYSLRSAIKGFYHHGVCLDWPHEAQCPEDFRWQSNCYFPNSEDAKREFPTVAQAKEARNIGLGAYFRLASVLNHFHAALNHAEAVIVSAKVHDGWGAPYGHGNGGRIKWPPDLGRNGTHAFVIVGYDRDGFHVLNSWGSGWGGYEGQAGIALWSYADWAHNIIDGWVLRLGVHAPNAFGESIGEHGTKGLVGKIASGSTPCLELIGHYAHLDDGQHVTQGAYPSFEDGWCKTRRYLKDTFEAPNYPDLSSDTPAYKGVLLWIPGSFEGIKQAFGASAQRKKRIKDMGLYPYSVFWCNGFAEKSIEVLQGLFKTCEEQAGSTAEHLDALIENEVRGVGRAIWRDMEMAAKRAMTGLRELPFESLRDADDHAVEGPLVQFFEELLELTEGTTTQLHVVTEGAGVLVLHEALAYLAEKRQTPRAGKPEARLPQDLFSSLHVVLPAIGVPRARDQILPLITAMNAGGQRRAHVYVPEQELEDRLCFGAYGKSILHLVSRAFEDRMVRDNDPAQPRSAARTFLGMAKGPETAGLPEDATIVRIANVTDSHFHRNPVPHQILANDPTFFAEITSRITQLDTPKTN